MIDAGAPIPAWVDGELAPYPKFAPHREGLRHMAVPAFVLRGAGEGLDTLIQRRAAGKYHTPGLWANGCCTHPHWRPGGPEDAALCTARRLREELGVERLELRPAGEIEYRADAGSGLIEHEVVHLFTAEAPDPDEVQEVRWTPLRALARTVACHPARYAPWVRIYLTEHVGRILAAAPAA